MAMLTHILSNCPSPACVRGHGTSQAARTRNRFTAAMSGVNAVMSVALVLTLTGCGLTPGEKKAPLRALYYEDLPNWGLPTEESVADESVDASVSPIDAAPPTMGNETTSESRTSSEAPTSEAAECPTELDGLTVGEQCIAGIGGCARGGTITCDGSTLACTAVAGSPSEEVCNGSDDDCNGLVDDIGGGECSAGTGSCLRTGTWKCVGGAPRCDAQPGAARVETCNGVDDDCDGSVDENQRIPEGCVVGVGGCTRYFDQVCTDGEFTCEDAVAGEPSVEVCNGLDDDCDGVVDDNAFERSSETCQVYVGQCVRPGLLTCEYGQWVCDLGLGEDPLDDCDGVDDDCDGEIDEDFVAETCTGGMGACHATGNTYCFYPGTVVCLFSGSSGSDPQPETCNGIDDDCDGETDEDFALGARCRIDAGGCLRDGVVECNGQGAAACSAGAGELVTDSCVERGECDASVPMGWCADAGVGWGEATSESL